MAVLARITGIVGRQTGGFAGVMLLALASTTRAETPCPEERRTERHYVLSARVRPLLFWIRRDNVGAGQITWTNCANGRKGLELLIGSDPDRVPMRINRWGYIGEFRHQDTADVLGVMTQSDEVTAEEAKQKVEQRDGPGYPYRAMRTRIQDGESTTTISHLVFPHTVTYRALDTVRERIPRNEGRLRLAQVPGNSELGFLNAVAWLIRESVQGYRNGGVLARGLSRRCLYASLVYDVTVHSTKAHPKFILGDVPHPLLESEFQVLNRETRRTSKFRILYGTGHPIAETPVRIVFRPNWWFEAELHLQEWPAGGSPE